MHLNTKVVVGFLSLAFAGACSDTANKAPLASEDCKGSNCGVTQPTGGGLGGMGSTGAGGATSVTTDGGTSTGLDCTTDPVTHITTCLGSTLCTQRIDPVAYAGCGYIPGQNVTVQCVCPNDTLCPVTVNTNCAAVTTQLNQYTSNVDVCNLGLSGTCPAITPTSGTGGGTSSDCSSCVQLCAGNPTCIAGCPCSTP